MKRHAPAIGIGAVAAWLAGAAPAAEPRSPPNLARTAHAAATSEYSADYAARFAIDGQIPEAGRRDDSRRAWCVRGDTHRSGAALTLTWPEPVTVAELVYYGRTAWFAEECWRGYELRADGDGAPLARGELQRGHGPQRIRLAQPRAVRELTLAFTSSYGGLNPGAAELEVYGAPLPDRALGRFSPLPPGPPDPAAVPPDDDDPGLAAAAAAGRLGFERLLVIQRHPIDSSHVYTYHTEGFRPGGGLCALDPAGGAAGIRRLVDAPEGQILDCDLSYDGRTVLFSWKRNAGDGYHLYTVGVDGSGLRALTEGRWHDYNACWLPDGGIAFLSTRAARFAYCWVSPVGLLYRMDGDGTNVRRLSANIVNDFTPSVLDDGRILYSRWEYVDRPAIPIQGLWAINPDGTGLIGFYGNRVLSPATFMHARSIPGTGKVLCTLTAHNGPARGAIGIVDRALGDNAQAAIVNLTPEIDIGRVDQGSGNHVRGPYETPWPLDRERYLVARGGAVFVREYASRRQALVAAPPPGAPGYANPIPLRPRPAPPAIPSSLPARTGEDGWATLFVQDVYAGLEPEVRRGDVAEIAVVQEMEKSLKVDLAHRAFDFQFPVISCGATYAGKRVWGCAPVRADGSACFRVPAGVPLYFLALDAEGRAVQRMRTFTHHMPGEVRGCIGCHEPRLGTSTRPRPTALARPDELRPPEWGGGLGFDYCTVVQPVLDRHCVRCHAGPAPPGGVDLCGDKTDYFNVSYETLARGRKGDAHRQWDSPYVSWIPTYNGHEGNILQIAPRAWGSPRSRLADLVLAGHPDADGQRRVALDEAERRRIFAWIDLNVPYYGTSEAAYPKNPGCRRLYPADLDRTLAEVATRRCAACHAPGVPRKVWTRITNPQRNDFLAAPLARAAGGSERCGRAVFAGSDDPDYQAILATFAPVAAMLQARPRDDMPGAVPESAVCRDCQ